MVAVTTLHSLLALVTILHNPLALVATRRSPVALATTPRSPMAAVTTPQSPLALVTTLHSPLALVTTLHSPLALVTILHNPLALVATRRSPVALATTPHGRLAPVTNPQRLATTPRRPLTSRRTATIDDNKCRSSGLAPGRSAYAQRRVSLHAGHVRIADALSTKASQRRGRVQYGRRCRRSGYLRLAYRSPTAGTSQPSLWP
jgi:hypothetical protein